MIQKTAMASMEVGIPFGNWLVNKGLIGHDILSEALAEQRKNGGRIGEVIVRMGHIEPTDLTTHLSEYLSVDSVALDDVSIIDLDIARRIPENIAKRFCLIAIGEEEGRFTVVMGDPLNVIAVDTVKMKLKRQVVTKIGSETEIRKAIEYIYHGSDIEEQRLRDLVEVEVSTEDAFSLEEEHIADISGEVDAEDAPVIRFVDLMLSHAIKCRASDIHIEPQEKSMLVRIRVDGVLREMIPPPRKMQSAVVTRLKILSEMDIAERRIPQDGRFKIKAPGRNIDVRVSSIPTIYGEKMVMRVLDKNAVNHDITKIGFEENLLDKFKKILKQPHGIIIVTGPTGSGKSTTLYSALSYLKDPRKNITTVEDPVEYRLDGINQIQVKPEIKLDFAICLRAILRQDPDIVLIGEIRDKETMEIAMKASMTGHLVLSTFHTNDAASAVSRFTFMGLEPYLLASTLNLIIAQRLVRKICDHCKQETVYSDDELRQLRLDPDQYRDHVFYQGKGCSNCDGSGFMGRTPIFEFIVVDDEIRKLIVSKANEAEIRKCARERGYGSLLDSGAIRVVQGLSTPGEILKVTFADDIE